jgi:hypothetical protein
MILGHAQFTTTMQVYTHVDEEARAEALAGLSICLRPATDPLWSEMVVKGQDRPDPARETPGGAKGGAKGTRTPDPLLAKQVLFQLSYSPRKPQVTRLIRDPSSDQ